MYKLYKLLLIPSKCYTQIGQISIPTHVNTGGYKNPNENFCLHVGSDWSDFMAARKSQQNMNIVWK